MAATAQPDTRAVQGGVSVLPTNGVVRFLSDPIQVEAARGIIDAPLGAPLYTYDRIDIGGRQVGRLTGVYRVIGSETIEIRAVLDVEASRGLPGASVGDAVEIDVSGGKATRQIVSRPEGATVTWNGHLVGTTPVDVPIVPGRYRFVLQKPGWGDTDVELVVREGMIMEESFQLNDAPNCDNELSLARAYYSQANYAAAAEAFTQVRDDCQMLGPEALRETSVTLGVIRELEPVVLRMRRAGLDADAVRSVGFALRNYRMSEQDRDISDMEFQLSVLIEKIPSDPLVVLLVASMREPSTSQGP